MKPFETSDKLKASMHFNFRKIKRQVSLGKQDILS